MPKEINKDGFVKIDSLSERKVLSSGSNLMLVAVRFKGTHDGYGIHTHIHEQITYVEEGEFEYVIENQKYYLIAGDSIYVKQNVEHGARCVSKYGLLIDAFSPVREDYI